MKAGSRQISLDVPVGSAWAALVSGDRQDWYYRLTPEGEFAEGNHIRWVDGAGKLAEESEIVEMTAPRRMVLNRVSSSPRTSRPRSLIW